MSNGPRAGMIVQPHVPLGDPVLLYNTRLWPGAGTLDNLGTGPVMTLDLTASVPSDSNRETFYRLGGARLGTTWADLGGGPDELPFTFMLPMSTSAVDKHYISIPAALDGAGGNYLGFLQWFLSDFSAGSGSAFVTQNVDGQNTLTSSVSSSGPTVTHLNLNTESFVPALAAALDGRDVMATLTFDMVHGGAGIFKSLAGIVPAGTEGSATRVRPAAGSGRRWRAFVGESFTMTLNFFGWYGYQGATTGRPAYVGLDELGDPWPNVGFAMFRGEPTPEDLAFWYDYFYPSTRLSPPFIDRVMVGSSLGMNSFGEHRIDITSRTPGSTPPSSTIVFPARDAPETVTRCRIAIRPAGAINHGGALGSLPPVPRVIVFEVDVTAGDELEVIAGNRGSNTPAELGVGGNPGGGAGAVSGFNGIVGPSGGGACLVYLNGELIIAVGAWGAGHVISNGVSYTGFFTNLRGGPPGIPDGTAGPGGPASGSGEGAGGTQFAGGLGGLEPIGVTRAESGSFLQGGDGAWVANTDTDDPGGPGGGAGYFGGGGAMRGPLGTTAGGGGGGSSWAKPGTVRVVYVGHFPSDRSDNISGVEDSGYVVVTY